MARRGSSSGPRITFQTAAVLQVMLTQPTHRHYGLQIAEQTHLPTGTIYPILARLEKAGWISSTWEERDPSELERPRRRLYLLTGHGAQAARAALADAHRLITLAPEKTHGQLHQPWENPA
jgi:DNA-binding PadR family transcriptional regulator